MALPDDLEAEVYRLRAVLERIASNPPRRDCDDAASTVARLALDYHKRKAIERSKKDTNPKQAKIDSIKQWAEAHGWTARDDGSYRRVRDGVKLRLKFGNTKLRMFADGVLTKMARYTKLTISPEGKLEGLKTVKGNNP